MQYKVLNVKSVDRGALLARFDLLLGHFLIRDFAVFQKNGEHWIGPPSRAFEDDEGQTRYFAFVKIDDKAVWNRFRAWALTEVLDQLGQQERINKTV